MTEKETALCCLFRSGISICGACDFSPELVLPNVRSAARLPKEAKTILLGLFPYYTGRHDERNLSLYSVIPDYHDIAGEMLKNACRMLEQSFEGRQFVWFADASPIAEVAAAVRAGLGVLGKNGQLITSDYGSMVFIGEIVTDLDLGAGAAPERECEGCMACVAACPTGALSANGFDKSRCRSFFSQKKGELTEWEAKELKSGGLAWGCDICTLNCPHNAEPKLTPITEFLNDVVAVADEDNIDRLLQNRAFAWRGGAVMRRNISLLKK